MSDIAIYGAGGFGREIACLIRLINKSFEESKWNFIGFFDDGLKEGDSNEYGKVLGGIDTLNQWGESLSIVIAIGSPDSVKKIVSNIKNKNITFPNIIAPNVTILDRTNVRIGKGNIICSDCLISCNVELGDFNLLNCFITVGHDTSIGNYNVIMPSCNISGGVGIGECNFMGLKSAILQYLSIGNSTRIGAGAIVMRNTKDGYLYIGIPAEKIEL